MIRHAKSLLLVWRIAELEAIHLRQDAIRPAHFFLGILKSVDIDLNDVLPQSKEDDLEEVKRDIMDLRTCVGEFVIDATYTRRFLRGVLPKGSGDFCQDNLRREKSSRMLFGEAEAIAENTRSPVLPTHLLLALLKSDNAQIKTVLENVDVEINDFKKYVTIFVRRCRKLPKSP